MFWIALIVTLTPKPVLILGGIVVVVIVVVFVYKLATDKDARDGTAYALALVSAHKGKPDAMNNLGVCCLKGEGVARDYGEAASWFRKAVDEGYGPAASNLALMYRKGFGFERNVELAAYWYQRAESLGASNAGDELAEMIIEARRHETGQQEEARQRQEGARREEQERRAANDSAGGMTRKLALEILDLKADATREQIEAAYKRMMIKNHPDAGGSTYFAKQLNGARDALLRVRAA